jgi:hypothetical protein
MSCAKYDTAFRAAEQQISDDLVSKKFRLGQNAYWGRVPDEGMFPEKSGTSIKKIRLSRIGFGQMATGWRNVEDNGCFSSICSEPPAEVISHGSEESFYGLQTFKIATDSICLAMLPFRQMAEKELAHFEEHLKLMSRYFWDEFQRTRYIHTCENKYVALVSDNVFSGSVGDVCDTLERQCTPFIEDSNGFIFWNRDPSSAVPVLNATFPIDERYISVNVPFSKIRNITELSGDLLEQAGINLELEDDNMPLLDQGIGLLDVIVPDIKVGRRLTQLERVQESECLPSVMYPGKELSRNLGISRIIREKFGIRRDLHGMKFYPDDAYNNTLSSYDANSPSTWPRFVRVLAYVPQRNANGTMKYVVNRYFTNAPFGISVIFTPTVMGMRHHPEAKSYGSATKGDMARNYAGTARWMNKYDKDCNPKEEIGHWELHFGAGIEPLMPENGNAFFHRIDHALSLSGVRCSIPILGCGEKGVTTDCYESVQTGEAALGVTAGGRGAGSVSHMNSNDFYI